MHKSGLVHRDIKPENILMHSKERLEIKIADFGFASSDDDLNVFLGTPFYMAPELVL